MTSLMFFETSLVAISYFKNILTKNPKEIISILFQIVCMKKRCNYIYIYIYILKRNKELIIHYENMSKMFRIYLKYI